MIALAKAGLLPGEGLDASKMPGHWLLARLGKRVLRPAAWSSPIDCWRLSILALPMPS